jgi:hypothetical protein
VRLAKAKDGGIEGKRQKKEGKRESRRVFVQSLRARVARETKPRVPSPCFFVN